MMEIAGAFATVAIVFGAVFGVIGILGISVEYLDSIFHSVCRWIRRRH